MQLRDYQHECIARVRSSLSRKNSALVVAACGAGKTEIFIEICRLILEKTPSARVLVLLNKVGLVEQTARRISKTVPCSIYCATLKSYEVSSVTVASVQSLGKLTELQKIDYLIIDEAHNFSSDKNSSYQKVFRAISHSGLKHIGFTATPWRVGGPIYGRDKLFDSIDFQISIQQLISLGFLVKPILKGSPLQFDVSKLSVKMGEYDRKEVSELVEKKDKCIEQVSDALVKLVGRKKTVWCCASIKQAEMVGEEIGEAIVVHSKMSNDEVLIKKIEFETTEVKHLVFVTMFSEGIDIPCVDSIVLLRPIRSPVFYVQVAGRGLRPFPGKEDCLILDYGQVIKTLGPLDKPNIKGFGSSGKKGKITELQMRLCPKCFDYIDKKELECRGCGFLFVTERQVKLAKTNDVSSNLFSSGPKINIEQSMDIKRIYFSKHMSAGGPCVRIAYFPDGIGAPINEYFRFDLPRSRSDLQLRISQLGIAKSLGDNVDFFVSSIGHVHDKNGEIVVKDNNGWPKILRVSF